MWLLYESSSDFIANRGKFIQKVLTNGKEYLSKLDIQNEGKTISLLPFQELDAAKTNLIAPISHGLETPIASLKMSLKLLADDRFGKLNDEQRKLVETMNEENLWLLKITGELLDMSAD
jgi:K+-sensing histidine kinase KdpD